LFLTSIPIFSTLLSFLLLLFLFFFFLHPLSRLEGFSFDGEEEEEETGVYAA